MAFRIELYTAGLLLLLSVLHTGQSAHIAAEKMADLGKDALTYLENTAKLTLRNHNSSHSVGCIEEPKEQEKLNCSIVATFFSYLGEAAVLTKRNTKMGEKLKAVLETVEGLHIKCGGNSTTCEAAFPGSKIVPKKLRSLLVLYGQWIVKPMQ